MKRLILVPLMLLAIAGTVQGQQIERVLDNERRPLLYDFIREQGTSTNLWPIDSASSDTSLIYRILPGDNLTSTHQISHDDDVMDYWVILQVANVLTLPTGATGWFKIDSVNVTDRLLTTKDWGAQQYHYVRFIIDPETEWVQATDSLTHVGIVFTDK